MELQRMYVLLAVCDPKLRLALEKALCKWRTSDSMHIIEDESDCDVLSDETFHLEAVIVDATHGIMAHWQQFLTMGDIYVFNLSYATSHVREVVERSLESHPATVVFCDEYILTPDDIDGRIGPAIGTLVDSPENVVVARQSYETPVHEINIVTPPKNPPHLGAFTTHICERIHLYNDRLINEYVPAEASPDSTLSSFKSEQIALEEELRAKCTAGGAEFLVIGPRGSGKTTLCNFVGTTMGEGYLLLSVDYTHVLEDDTETRHRDLHIILQYYETLLRPQMESTQYSSQPHAWPQLCASELEEMTEHRNFDRLGEIPHGIISILGMEYNKQAKAAMYLYYELGKLFEEEQVDHNLYEKSRDWYRGLHNDPPRMFAYYLNYYLNVHSRISIRRWTFRELLLSLTRGEGGHFTELAALICERDEPALAIALRTMDSSQVYFALKMVQTKSLESITLHVLSAVARQRKIVLLFDNVDQRPSEEMEANLIAKIAALYQKDIRETIKPALTLFPMRQRTLDQQKWIRSRLTQWQEFKMRPVDFASILQRRCRSWFNVQRGLGERSRAMVLRIRSLVDAWTEPTRVRRTAVSSPAQVRGSRARDLDLLDIIQERHPYDIASRLREFADCCSNPLLQNSLLQAPADGEGIDNWTNSITFQFYVRVFLLGAKPWFSETDRGIINLYDHGRQDHPLNASIRGWILLHFDENESQKRETINRYFANHGVDEELINSAIDSLIRFHVVRYKSKAENELQISKWGRFFRKHIAFDLPYASTVWWYTSMLPQYSLGTPFVPSAADLREISARFLRWLRLEETLSSSCLSKALPDELSVFAISNFRILHSLRRIEKDLRSRRRGG